MLVPASIDVEMQPLASISNERQENNAHLLPLQLI